MIDPYKVLGVSQDTSDDEIKKAYRTLSRKYHPDANINNPLKNEAEVKFKEVQQAYQQIMDEREKGYSASGGQQEGYGGFGNFGGFGAYGNKQQSTSGNSEADIHLRAAANYIQSAHYAEALHVLDEIKEHSALWYFYSASANSGTGNNVTALEHAQKAAALEPDNMQYRLMLQRLQGTGDWYQQRQDDYGYTGMGGNALCMRLCIASMVCNLCFSSGICCNGGGYGGGYGRYF